MEGNKCPHCGYDPKKEQVVKVTISDETMPAYGAYLSPSARQGKAQVVLDFALHYATAKHCGEDFVPLLSQSATHELGHALQELLGRAFSESDVERIAQAAQNVEVADDDLEFREKIAEGERIGQELLEACEAAKTVIESVNDGPENSATVEILRAAIAKAKGEDYKEAPE